jgi:hypothetical protein
MSFYVVYDSATGRPITTDTADSPPRLREGQAVAEFPSRPLDAEMWDPASKAFVPRPRRALRDLASEIVQRAVQDPLLLVLTSDQRRALREAAAAVLGDMRLQ